MSVQPTSHQGPRLPTRRAFVVQFAAETTAQQGAFEGRVEHVVSGQAQRFRTQDELMAFMQRVLTILDTGDTGDTDDPPPSETL